ncbi:hypothetical protein P175DRAFT_0149650 [Aspergillus ochraceoroseus IBT 24754]|uniref:Uncharacterized protein n=1 Tax=Aspergillus ochraceoroseus IBT 24754 TaxID=1392256 RepID=A0A2T5M300_9EURO|nr:uncharacterized protein P175DRAFT_0149650 [Aspergillus ochraceoroseus IBT 24754]PTU22907.1 hypothetical protein P175DRAFT_0149650 [Aspergillus ochraceoroseus IBT 24754]
MHLLKPKACGRGCLSFWVISCWVHIFCIWEVFCPYDISILRHSSITTITTTISFAYISRQAPQDDSAAAQSWSSPNDHLLNVLRYHYLGVVALLPIILRCGCTEYMEYISKFRSAYQWPIIHSSPDLFLSRNLPTASFFLCFFWGDSFAFAPPSPLSFFSFAINRYLFYCRHALQTELLAALTIASEN